MGKKGSEDSRDSREQNFKFAYLSTSHQLSMSRRPMEGCLENGHNGASENKRPRMELPFNGGQPASTSTVTSTNGVLMHRNGFPSHQPAAEFSSKCPICLWPLFSPRCY